MTNRLSIYFAQLKYVDGPHYQGDELWLGKANCPAVHKGAGDKTPPQRGVARKSPISPAPFFEPCDDEHLKRVEPRKGDSVVVCWTAMWFWLSYFCVLLAVAILIARYFG